MGSCCRIWEIECVFKRGMPVLVIRRLGVGIGFEDMVNEGKDEQRK